MAYSKQNTSTKLVSESFVKPKHEIDPTKQFYPLGPIDLAMLDIDPIQKGLLYKLDPNSSRTKVVSNLLHNLKNSLAIALIHFYPLAGRFITQQFSEHNSCSILINCNKGPGVRVIYATNLDLSLSDILSPIDVTITHPFFDLGEKYVNYDGHTRALLCIQVTEIFDGVFIGFSINHSVVDGTSFTHFMNMLSEIFTSHDQTTCVTQISKPPIFNYRPWLGNDDENVEPLKLPFLDPMKFIHHGYNPGPLRERIFHFSAASMAKLKAKANQECDTHNEISSFQSLVGLVWRSMARARGSSSGQEVSFGVAMGARARFEPPLSEAYFGNYLCRAQWSCKEDELMGSSLGWAALNFKKVIAAQDGKQVVGFLKEVAASPIIIPRGLEPNPNEANNMSLGGSARFNMYGAEFGLGRALGCRMGYGNKADGKVTANPGCEGDGSVELEICLRPNTMDALEADEEFMSFVSFTSI